VNDFVGGAHSPLVLRLYGDDFKEMRRIGGEIVDVGRMIVMVRCLGPLASAVINGRFTCYSLRLLS